MSAPAKNKGGRPPKYPGEGRRRMLSFRVRGGTYERLVEAALVSGRSLSEEIEIRVCGSFESETMNSRFDRLELLLGLKGNPHA